MGREQVSILYSLDTAGQGQSNSEVGQGQGLLEEGKLTEGTGVISQRVQEIKTGALY